MKLSSSPFRNKNLNEPSALIKSRIQKQLQKPYRPIVSLFTKNQQEEKIKNTNSITKVLKELTDLKKQLKEIKNSNKQQKISQPLDMSQCRKIQQQAKKSPESRKRIYTKSNSSSKGKGNSQPKRQTSTQTLQKYREVNDFSFSIDSKIGKKSKNPKQQSQEEDSQINEQEFSNKKSTAATKRLVHKSLISPRKININQEISSKVANIQHNQLYEQSLNSLKLSLQIFQISTPILTTEDKLKLNIQIERLSKHITRIPIYFKLPQQYYEAMQLYARSLNNQLNNLVLILNRSQHLADRLREKVLNSPNRDQRLECRKCDEHQKRGVERANQKQMKRFQKQLQKLQTDLSYKDSLIKQLKQAHENSLAQLKEYKQITKMHKQSNSQLLQKCERLRNQGLKLQKQKQNAESKEKQKQERIKCLEQDLSYYKSQLQRVKNHNKVNLRTQKQEFNPTYVQLKVRQLENLVVELKDKQKLYEIIIQQKDYIIKNLQVEKQFYFNSQAQSKNKAKLKQEHDQQSIDSADYHKLKIDIEQLHNKISAQTVQITQLKQQKAKLQLKNQQISNNLQLCLDQINKLNTEISVLQQANQKYKDKYLKNRIVNEKKSKKQHESQIKKGQTFQQIKQLIKHHKQEITKQK